jgi:uncharacterized protein (TIGR02996 family)
MTSEQLAQLDVFLDEIRDAPDDDLPRLVLGDWLFDQGDPRGEFIQIDVRLPLLDDGPLKRDLEKRRRELLSAHAVAWLGPLMDLVRSWRWERGMLHVEARLDRLGSGEGLEAIRAGAFEWVEGLRLEVAVRSPHDLRLAERLARLPALDLGGNDLRTTGLRYLLHVGGPNLAGLRWLGLANNRIEHGGIEALADCPHLARLTRLDLSGNAINDRAARALIESPHLHRLRHLNLGHAELLMSTFLDLLERFGPRVAQVTLPG